MNWMQALTIIGTLGTFSYWLFSRLDSDVKESFRRIDIANQRIDQLYQMFVDLLREKR